MGDDRRAFGVRLSGVAALALVVRIAYAMLWSRTAKLGFDAATYYELAKHLTRHHAFLSPFDHSAHPKATALFPPAYPALLAALRWIGFGTRTKLLIAMAVLGSATVAVIGCVGRRLAGDRAGLLAALLAAIYPNLFMADGALMTESLTALLVALTLLLVLRTWERPSARRWLAVGAVAAVASLTRSDGWLLALIVVIPAALFVGAGGVRRRITAALIAMAIPAAAVAAWEVRNEVRMHAFVPIAVNSWDVIGGANCSTTYYGHRIGSWVLECLEYGHDYGEIVANRHARDVGFDYARDHLGRVPLVIAARLGRTFGVYQPWKELEIEAFYEGRSEDWSKVGFVMYAVLAVLAIVGAAALRRQGTRRELRLLLAPVAMAVISTIAAYGNHRLRIPMEPSTVLLASIGALALRDRARRHGSTTTSSPV